MFSSPLSAFSFIYHQRYNPIICICILKRKNFGSNYLRMIRTKFRNKKRRGKSEISLLPLSTALLTANHNYYSPTTGLFMFPKKQRPCKILLCCLHFMQYSLILLCCYYFLVIKIQFFQLFIRITMN